MGETAGKKDQRKRRQRQAEPRARQKNGTDQNQQAKQKQKVRTSSVGITDKQALGFARDGHALLRELVPGDELSRLRRAVETEYQIRADEAIAERLQSLGVNGGRGGQAALAKACGARGLPCPTLQVYNIHRASRASSRLVSEFACSARMGWLAADLLGVDAVMLYQTAAFFKHAGEGETAWHSDLNTAPFDTNDMVTLWIALTPVPTERHSPLIFAQRSHRDFALPYWHTLKGMEDLDTRGYTLSCPAPLAPGDATAHHGWTVHAAPPNDGAGTRKALGVAFVAAEARRLGDKQTRQEPNDADRKGYRAVASEGVMGNSHEAWIADIRPGQPVRHPLLPVVYTRPRATKRVLR